MGQFIARYMIFGPIMILFVIGRIGQDPSLLWKAPLIAIGTIFMIWFLGTAYMVLIVGPKADRERLGREQRDLSREVAHRFSPGADLEPRRTGRKKR